MPDKGPAVLRAAELCSDLPAERSCSYLPAQRADTAMPDPYRAGLPAQYRWTGLSAAHANVHLPAKRAGASMPDAADMPVVKRSVSDPVGDRRVPDLGTVPDHPVRSGGYISAARSDGGRHGSGSADLTDVPPKRFELLV